MDIEVELSQLVVNENSEQQVIVLKEKNGARSLPIVIGIVEVMAIDRRLRGIKAPRPMTHDLIGNIINATGATFEKVVITDLQAHTYYAKIHIKCNGQIAEVDSRPSDAIALVVATGVPIYVAEEVFDKL